MISNKLVTIIKENQFDKGWTIFSPASFGIDRNRHYKSVDLTDVIRLITFSNKVNLVLSEVCLPSRVVNELEWCNKYIQINLIAKNKTILERYKNLTFNSYKVDETININYIGVSGKNNGYFLLSETILEVDESIDSTLFGALKNTDKYGFLNDARLMIVCNAKKHCDFDDLLSIAEDYGIACNYVMNSKYFDRMTYDYARDHRLDLYISDYVDDAVLIVRKDNSIYRMISLNDECIVLSPIEKIGRYVGELFKSLFLTDTVDVNKFPAKVYTCYDGKNEPLNIVDEITISEGVVINEMQDFINEVFDSSITEKHNDYSNRAKAVRYQFTLVPPLMDVSYHESSIYAPIHRLYDEWIAFNEINLDRIVDDYRSFMNNDVKLIAFVAYAKGIADKLSQMVTECSYIDYYVTLKEAIHEDETYQNQVFEDCAFMFNEINSESSGTKFDKFDVEIDGYRKTIKEKEELISKGVDVLNNKRRVEVLTKKIDDLLVLKAKFEGNAAQRYSKEADDFIKHCKELVYGGVPIRLGEGDSIERIVNIGEESKMVKLNAFVSNYLRQIADYVSHCIDCLKNMKKIKIPEKYPVFEKDGQRFIVIDEVDEYVATKALRDEFALKCLARR